MKKELFLIFIGFLVSLVLISFVYAYHNESSNGNAAENETENKTQEKTEVKVIKNKTREVKNITFVPWQKRNESECLQGCKCRGAVMSCETEEGRTITIQAGKSGNIIIITIVKGQDDDEVEDDDEEDIEANTTLEIETENETEIERNRTINKTKIKAKLSNGRKAEIKIMPDTASERAIERLGQLNFTIELKEVPVGRGNETILVYELQAERHYRILALFKAKAKLKAQVDAENGEIIIIKKPWWAFLALAD